MASLICSALVLLATYFLLPALYYLPKCVLASMFVFPFRPISTTNEVYSIILVVFSLLAEVPDDVAYFFK